MKQLFLTAAAPIALMGALFVAMPAFAQTPKALRSPEDAAEFCSHSVPRADSETETDGYDAVRRRTAQRPFEVLVSSDAAAVVGFDRLTSSLEFVLPRAAKFAQGYAITANLAAVGFELTEVEAQKIWARYRGGTIALKVTMLPPAWSDYDQPLCRDGEGKTIIDGELLTAQLVDEVGRPVATFRTALGREVALMRDHRIRGYLDSGTPVVTVSALTPHPSGTLKQGQDVRLRAAIRTALYGCYLRGLAANGRLQGALVLKIGRAETSILVDSLHDEKTQGCALDRIAKMRSPDDGLADLKATVIFRLEEAPNL